MAETHPRDKREPSSARRHSVPDILALDEVASGTGASLIIALAATIAVVLAVVVGVLSAPAAAASNEIAVSTSTEAEAPAGPGTAPRDQFYDVAPLQEVKSSKSLAFLLIGSLLLVLLAPANAAWQSFGRRIWQTGREIP